MGQPREPREEKPSIIGNYSYLIIERIKLQGAQIQVCNPSRVQELQEARGYPSWRRELLQLGFNISLYGQVVHMISIP